MDFNKMRLAAKGNTARLDEILQLELRHKHAAKLDNTLLCPDFRFPDSLAAEQSTGDLLAHWHASLTAPGDRVLDMTAGLGIDTFHIARRAASVTAIELKPHVAQQLAANATALGLRNIEVLNTDSVAWLNGSDARFDTIFIDPARRDALSGKRVYAMADCTPDVTVHAPLLRARASRVIIKVSPMIDVSHTFAELGPDIDITAVGTPTECKELVITIPGTGRIEAITLASEPHETDGSDAAPADAIYVHELFPAAMKAGLFTSHFEGLTKPAPNTHLFFGRALPSFPGRRNRVLATIPFDKRSAAALATAGCTAAEIAVRNFGMPADNLRDRLKLRDSSTMRLYAYRDADGRRWLTLTAKA